MTEGTLMLPRNNWSITAEIEGNFRCKFLYVSERNSHTWRISFFFTDALIKYVAAWRIAVPGAKNFYQPLLIKCYSSWYQPLKLSRQLCMVLASIFSCLFCMWNVLSHDDNLFGRNIGSYAKRTKKTIKRLLKNWCRNKYRENCLYEQL
jgi:hypothetical protein